MAAAILTPPAADDGTFTVSDAMYAEVQAVTRCNPSAVMSVFYPAPNDHGWTFEITGSAREAEQLAAAVGPDAVTLYL